jgi:Resolvase, N terminal domain
MNATQAGKFVAYYRVSTQQQGRGGLGLEAQQRAVQPHLAGGRGRIVAEYVETENGKKADRPKLADALKACRVHKSSTGLPGMHISCSGSRKMAWTSSPPICRTQTGSPSASWP